MNAHALTAALEAAAVIVSAGSAMIAAARERMDIVGTYYARAVVPRGRGRRAGTGRPDRRGPAGATY
ncbi:MAG TPA: hypothetical protein VH854_17225 [Thermoanaerobaculia bacterium]|nr:hypothetical protein [Thermoanaerobaculia bacterium]